MKALPSDLRVLVIDDHDIQRKVVVKRLEALGLKHIMEGADGGEGLRVLAEHPIDLVLCDLDMPYIDGLEFVRCVVESSLDVAVAFLSAADSVIIECADLMTQEQPIRFLGAVEKPISMEQLTALLNASEAPQPKTNAPEQQPLAEIEAGLARGEFVPFFQPIVEASTGKPSSAEALARWHHPELGVLTPASFLDAIDTDDGVNRLTWAILDGTLETVKAATAMGFDLPISINLSGHFLKRRGVADAIRTKLDEAQVQPRQITIEVTESTALTTVVNCLENLARLRMRGHNLVADDFGTAYASLKQLVRVPFQAMKFDRSLLLHALSHERAWTVLRASVAMARDLHMTTVIEGVETEAQLERLADVRSDRYQGFYFARPMAADNFLDWLKQQ